MSTHAERAQRAEQAVHTEQRRRRTVSFEEPVATWIDDGRAYRLPRCHFAYEQDAEVTCCALLDCDGGRQPCGRRGVAFKRVRVLGSPRQLHLTMLCVECGGNFNKEWRVDADARLATRNLMVGDIEEVVFAAWRYDERPSR